MLIVGLSRSVEIIRRLHQHTTGVCLVVVNTTAVGLSDRACRQEQLQPLFELHWSYNQYLHFTISLFKVQANLVKE